MKHYAKRFGDFWMAVALDSWIGTVMAMHERSKEPWEYNARLVINTLIASSFAGLVITGMLGLGFTFEPDWRLVAEIILCAFAIVVIATRRPVLEYTAVFMWTMLLKQNKDRPQAHQDYYLMLGLLKNNRWRDLGDLVTDFSVLTFNHVEIALFGVIHTKFSSSVSKWLAQDSDFATTSIREIAVALFGEGWCTVVYDLRADGESLGHLIAATRPDFLPGRLTGTSVPPVAINLPDLSF